MTRRKNLWLVLLLGILLCGPESLFAFKLISFDGKPSRWFEPNPPYVVDSRGSDNFDRGCDQKGPCVDEFEAIRLSFETWAGVGGTDLSFETQRSRELRATGYDGENALIFVESGWTSLPFSPPAGALAVTISTYRTSDNAILDGDIHFNGEFFTWGVVDTEEEIMAGNVIDIQNVATHEIGHFIGLDHSSENIYEPDPLLYLATMFFASGPGETFRRELDEDDIAAMQNLYADVSYEAPQVDAVTPGQIDAYQGTAVVSISGDHFQPFASVVIATNSDRGDISGRVLRVDSDSMEVAFEVYALTTGLYDIVVANSPESFDRVDDALDVQGSGYNYGENGYEPGTGLASSSGGGCNVSHRPNESGSKASTALMLILPLILIGWSRFHLKERTKKVSIVSPLREPRRPCLSLGRRGYFQRQ